MTKRAQTLVELPTPLVERATTFAKSRRRTVSTVIASALERYLDELPRGKKPATKGRAKKPAGNLSDLFALVRGSLRDVPATEWKKLPRNGARNHDRQIYGRP